MYRLIVNEDRIHVTGKSAKAKEIAAGGRIGIIGCKEFMKQNG